MRHARVFLVEDEALIRLMLAEMIEELGHQIVAEAGPIESACHWPKLPRRYRDLGREHPALLHR